jgi:hypothetical protein
MEIEPASRRVVKRATRDIDKFPSPGQALTMARKLLAGYSEALDHVVNRVGAQAKQDAAKATLAVRLRAETTMTVNGAQAVGHGVARIFLHRLISRSKGNVAISRTRL